MGSARDSGLVRRRQVFYLPGYDPFPPRRYRELYRKEGAAQARLSGHALAIKGAGGQAWEVAATMDGVPVEARIEVLVWHDIVSGSMSHGIARTYLQLVRTAWAYIGTGALFRLMRLRIGPMIAALYPIGVLLLQLGLAILLGVAAGELAERVLPDLVALGIGLGVVWAVLEGFRRIDGRLFAYYLMHDYAYSAQHGGANPPELEARLAVFADRIAEALRDETLDEVLVVGHSSGAHLAVSILADLLRSGRLPEDGPELALLSLGHVVPMVSFLPKAHRLRADLATLGSQDRVAWVDVTAPGDGCSFALCDPVLVSGQPKPGPWPLVLSAAFTRTLAPETWARLRRRYFRLHFQYLCAFDALPDRADAYDYFRVTAGPMTLRARYADRPPSPSRIERAVNGFTDTAP